MAVDRGGATLLIEEDLRRPFYGRLLQLGRSEIFFTAGWLNRAFRKSAATAHNRADLAALPPHSGLDDRRFFSSFGFSSIEALDCSDFSGASIIFDLNSAELPPEYHGLFDCIFDSGSMEHVFHVPNLLKNVFRLLAVGGRVIHMTPAANSVDHGFYSFSPGLYYQYYRENGFEVNDCRLVDRGARLLPDKLITYNYLPPIPRKVLDGYLPGHVHHVYCVATKTAHAQCDVIPQQDFYLGLWEGGKKEVFNGPARKPNVLKEWIKRRPALDSMARTVTLPAFRAARKLRSRRYLRSRVKHYSL
jgi:SAM-dependent methyltransferase